VHRLGLTKLINYSLSLFPLVLEYGQTKYYFITLGPATAGSAQTVDADGNAVKNVLK
jgi:hypothetical protein